MQLCRYIHKFKLTASKFIVRLILWSFGYVRLHFFFFFFFFFDLSFDKVYLLIDILTGGLFMIFYRFFNRCLIFI